MSLRAKLLASYATMFLLAVVMVVIGHGAARRWHKTADELSRSYEQGVVAERLRWAIVELADNSMEGLLAGAVENSPNAGLPTRIARYLDTLQSVARMSTDSSLELDHVRGLAETYRDLDLVIAQIEAAGPRRSISENRDRWITRLQEITDETDDAAIAVEQYFRERNRRALVRADEIRQLAVTMTGAAVGLIAIQFLVMAFLLSRWVTRPVADLEAAADQIGAGQLELTLPPRNEREWRKVSDALHHMTRSLALLQQQLRVSERLSAVGEVAAYTAHNIRNPIASIRAMAQVGLPDANGNPAIESTLKDIISCVDKMEQWIAGLLNFARPLELSKTSIDLRTIAQTVFSMTSNTANSRGIGLQYDAFPTALKVKADEAFLEQALHAIISNAIDAVASGGNVWLSMSIEETSSQRRARLTIRDNGPGISPELLPNVFKPFVTGKTGGSGLGLAQAKKIIDLHLGEISIESTMGTGTTVTVSLPLSEDEHGTSTDH